MPKILNPYQRLKKVCQGWAQDVKYRHSKTMWEYKKTDIEGGREWDLSYLYQRVKAADQLGYDVRLEAKDTGLTVIYIQRPPEIPWELRDRGKDGGRLK